MSPTKSARGGTVDWFYARPGCESCEKTRHELAARGTAVIAERSTKQPLTDDEARGLLASVDEVALTRGRSFERRVAREVRPDDLKGPTGGFRAPMLRRGRKLLVGFGAAHLKEWLGET